MRLGWINGWGDPLDLAGRVETLETDLDALEVLVASLSVEDIFGPPADTSGTPGNFTTTALAGRSAFGGTIQTVVMTNSRVSSTSVVVANAASGNGRIIEPLTIAAGSVTFRRSSASVPNEQFVWVLVP